MKYDFDQAKQAVAERHGYESWGEYEYASFMKTGETHSIWEEVFQIGCNEAVKVYARQFKEVAQEPTEEETRLSWSDWYDENGGNNTQDAWEAAIDWYKQKTNRE